jgi:hypothetical protein
MKKYSLLFLLLITSMIWVKSFHIVGGEIEFITIQPGLYQINLLQYKDEFQQQNTSYDPSLFVAFYSNKDSSLVHSDTLLLQTITDVEYTNFECAIQELQTSRVLYSKIVSLDPEKFAHEEGYYIVWERCCRNNGVVNIINPSGTGMKYVLEIPPLWKNDRPFINSTPVLNKPLSDYACINQLYYVDFIGQDLDGDSLSYRLATPLNSSSQVALPSPKPKPHLEVNWRPGYSLTNMIPGPRPLQIDNKGFLTVNPINTGLYVFSVIIEEWRDKKKIGEMQRDFQMLVVDGCDPPDPPQVSIKITGNDDFNVLIDTLNYSVEDDKCFEFVVANIQPGENISFIAKPVNFEDINGVVEEVFSIEKRLVGANQDTLILTVCAPGCPPIIGRPFIIDLIAADDACPLPQLDTVRLIMNVEPPPNNDPLLDPIQDAYIIDENDILIIPFTATDEDPDQLVSKLSRLGVTEEEDLMQWGFSLDVTRDELGLIQGNLIWDSSCGTADFSEQQTFVMSLAVDDLDVCNNVNESVETITFSVVLPPNTTPLLTTTASGDLIELVLGDGLGFDVFVNDGDMDLVSLEMVGVGFDPESLGIDFDTENGLPSGSAKGLFNWDTNCELLNVLDKDFYTFLFVAEDSDKCQELNRDTLEISIQIVVPENNPPRFESYGSYEIEVNTTFELAINAVDPDGVDSVTVRFFDGFRRPRTNTLSFSSQTGFSEASSILRWTPECDLLDLGETSRSFEMVFQTFDDRCPIQGSETMSIVFEVKETRDFYDRFDPANAFSPNGDGINDFYSMSDLPNPNQNLPPNNCDDEFQYIIILDRSGTKIFKSEEREFVWHGSNAQAGVYYYFVKYAKTEYKGFVQLLK